MSIIHKAYSLRSAEQGDSGEFSGTALVYGERDSGGDVIREGAFRKSIVDSGGKFPLLYNHNPADTLGSVDVTADGRALSVKGSMLLDAIPRAAQVFALLKAKAIKGLSVSFLSIRSSPTADGGREFSEARLLEISLTPIPAYASAAVHEVKSLDGLIHTLDRNALQALHKSIGAMLEPQQDDLAAALALDLTKWR